MFENETWFDATEEARGYPGPVFTIPQGNAPIMDLVLKSFVECDLPLDSDMVMTAEIGNGCGPAVHNY